MKLASLIKGFPGHPTHPPLTDATIGAYTVGTVLVVLAWFGVAPDRLSDAGFLAILLGLVFAVPTAITGFIDYLSLDRGSPMSRTALIHMLVMLAATGGFAVASVLLARGPAGGVGVVSGVVTVASFVALTAGGWIGGSLVFVHGTRVLGKADASTSEAIAPKAPSD